MPKWRSRQYVSDEGAPRFIRWAAPAALRATPPPAEGPRRCRTHRARGAF
jgi:hypothetical protein